MLLVFGRSNATLSEEEVNSSSIVQRTVSINAQQHPLQHAFRLPRHSQQVLRMRELCSGDGANGNEVVMTTQRDTLEERVD